MKHLLLPLLLLLGLGSAQAAPLAPDVAVKQATEEMRDLIRANHQAYSADKAKFYAVVDESLVPHFDVRYIAQLVLGKNWRTANEDQRTRFANAFKNSLIRSYADALLENYDSVDAEFQPLRLAADANDATVRAKLIRKNAPPVNLAFAMRPGSDGEWKIYDVIIENLSLVTNFRSQFNSEIKKTGLDGLIQRVESSSDYLKESAKGA
jgi:phospholipid transport system substrate-binding protein